MPWVRTQIMNLILLMYVIRPTAKQPHSLCKQIVYNAATYQQMLCPTWISRASATQRSGRTGRGESYSLERIVYFPSTHDQ